MSKKRCVFIAALAILPLTSAQAQQRPSETTSAEVHPTTTSYSLAKPASENPNYVIGPQDVLDINVWKEPELSRTIPVRPDGKISLPLINDIQAAGLTPLQLAAEVKSSLDKFVTNPQITVIVSQINSQRIYLLGEVGKPGAFPMIPDMTVLQALSNAGGISQFAKAKKIYVLRDENGKQQKLFFNYKEVIAGQRTEQNIALKPGDTIVVP